MSSNDQYLPGNEPFGMSGIAHTGAPGTDSPGADSSSAHPDGPGAGPVVGIAVMSTPLASVQGPGAVRTMAVHAGDTDSSYDDEAVHASALLPGPVGQYEETGAGEGHAQMRHPNAGQ